MYETKKKGDIQEFYNTHFNSTNTQATVKKGLFNAAPISNKNKELKIGKRDLFYKN